MNKKQVWFITGTGRGLGVEIAKAALTAGHAVVGTAREIQSIERALGKSDDLLAVKLDITKPIDAELAVRSAIERFGHIDVLVNNAGNFYAGYFEDLSPEDIQKQIDANLIGPMNVTRAVLPEMRKQKSGLVVLALWHHDIIQCFRQDLYGIEFGLRQITRYRNSAWMGWMLSLASEI
jgi:NAD(P)-dependent dehydrogenase (short-subunit alcohol dehydrogenase family)